MSLSLFARVISDPRRRCALVAARPVAVDIDPVIEWFRGGVRLPLHRGEPPFDVAWFECRRECTDGSIAPVGVMVVRGGHDVLDLSVYTTHGLTRTAARVPADWRSLWEIDDDRPAVLAVVRPVEAVCRILACRNIAVVETRTEPPKRRRVNGERVPGHRWHTLAIVPNGARKLIRRDDPGPRPRTEPLMAAHLVRGHFKTYTADAPLFGKHVGTVFVRPHMRGSESLGTVGKDYRVEAPEVAA